MPLEWTPSLSTGIPRIDSQHQSLIYYVNALDAHTLADDSPASLLQTLDFLIDYVATHFRDEEACMNAHRCPAAAENKCAHENLTALLLAYRQRLRLKGPIPGLRKELHARLHGWVESHICRVDSQLHAYVPATVQTSLPR